MRMSDSTHDALDDKTLINEDDEHATHTEESCMRASTTPTKRVSTNGVWCERDICIRDATSIRLITRAITV